MADEPIAPPRARRPEPSADSRPTGWDVREPPRWARRLVWETLIVIAAAATLLLVLRTLGGLILWLLYAVFLSLALEPAVGWLEKRGWSRRLSAFVLLLVLGLAIVALVLLVIPVFINGLQVVVDELPRWLESWSSTTERCCNITLDPEGVRTAIETAGVTLASLIDDAFAVLAGSVGSLISGVFAAFTVALFAYYMIVQFRNVRRSILSLLPPQRQEDVVYIWDTAIEKMGGYVYSRLALALINGGLFFIVLLAVDVPFALPLAMFQGFVAAFIPIVGTYIAVIVPALVAWVTAPTYAVVAVIIYALVYQQVENYWLSPKISSKTMALHPAVALGAGIAGGAIGGLLWAFIALPVAATIQAALAAYVERHEVIETEYDHPVGPGETRSWRSRVGRWRRRASGAIRAGDQDGHPPSDPPV
jgi:predicted PurR-regulated permease PerM